MERTVPRPASEEIELYLRTVYSLVRASSEIRLRSLEEAHAGMNSLLHLQARGDESDMSAFIYAVLRLPPVMEEVERVVLGQTPAMYAQRGFGDITAWACVDAAARRRRCYYDGKGTLACLLVSRSDIEDLLPILTAYQIEWNKLHRRLNGAAANGNGLAAALGLPDEDLARLRAIWKERFEPMLERIRQHKCDLRIQLLSGSLTDYRRAMHGWWERIQRACPDLAERPVYFISSNAHSLVNIASGFALRRETELSGFLDNVIDPALRQEWEDIQAEVVPSSRENFFYYVLKKYMNTPQGRPLKAERAELERRNGITRIASDAAFETEAQVFDLARLDPEAVDPRLGLAGTGFLKDSRAAIINIDYPLGMAAYHVLAEIAEQVGELRGVYMMGKAATLNGVVGDVMLPDVVYDGQSGNTYLFENCLRAEDVAPHLVYGSVLDAQKAVSVRGTFLENHDYMDVFYREGYTDIEMEAGPYLSAIYELVRPKRYPLNEIVDLHNLPFELGVLHYASDKPLSKGRNLGVANLSYFGMDPTYAGSIAILRHIFAHERQLQAQATP
ncbi:MAG: hypothetical protein EPO32_13710 [Anaerolineae bacterium]|nr:MAG: hypothetical protein EPO32_13710 [Anaerolineae bacterium]